jgi:cytochrome c2
VAKLTPKVDAHAEALYTGHCAPCHQKTGEGMKGKVPPLAGNPTVEATTPDNILSVVLQGIPARDGFLAMPSFADQLTDQDIADIANYVRITWGNKAEPDATAQMVASWRKQVKLPAPPKSAAKPDADASSSKAAEAAPAKTAEAATPAKPLADPLPKSKPFYIVTSDLIGLSVHSQSAYGETLGTLSSLVIDSATGQTLYAIIDRGGFLGLGEYKVVVPFKLVQFTGQWDNPMLAMSAFKLENAPRVDDNAVEDLLQSADWRRSVDAYFGVALSQSETSTKPGDKTEKAAEASPEKKESAPAKSSADAAADKGKQIAETQCSACHHFNKGGGTLVGPDLYGVYGTKIASVPGYSFSAALKKHTGDWDAANLNEWLKSPSTFAPGTYMTFPGLPSQQDRDDVIAYLKSLK